MVYYYGTVISEHITKKLNGGIVCTDVPIARTGVQEYLAREIGLGGDPERVIEVIREPDEVFDPAAMASFEGACVCDNHPPENVTSTNFSQYSKGHVQNIRRTGDYLIGDIHIDDAVLADQVLHRTKRGVSCGYTCSYQPLPDGRYKQVGIRGNHLSVVPRGRAGASVSIHDSAESAGKGKKRMKKETKEALYRFFGLAARDAEPEELEKLTSDLSKVMDSEPDKPAETPPAGDAKCGAGDGKPETVPAMDEELRGTLDAINKRLEALENKNDREEKALRDEDDLDDLVKKLSGGEHVEKEASVTIPADEMTDMDPAARDAAVELLKKVRPAVAAIKDEQERSRVVDALISTIKGPNVMGQVMQATAANARKAADAAKASTFEERCREAEAAYAARNPHKKQKED